jgi:serine/threonine-protein kinase
VIRHACPPEAELARSLEADTDSGGEVAGHLASCEACRARLDRLAAGDSDWLLSPPRPEQAHPALEAALRELVPPEPDDAPAALPAGFLDPPVTPDGLGTIGRYEVTKMLGRGGSGVVLKAIDAELMRPVAVKILDPLSGASGTARERFAREGRAAAAVAHENVVGIFAVERWKGLPYLVMEYLAGGSLQTGSTATAPCHGARSPRSAGSWRPGCRRPTPRGWSTATSSRPTPSLRGRAAASN